jgi:hypothetical protein
VRIPGKILAIAVVCGTVTIGTVGLGGAMASAATKPPSAAGTYAITIAGTSYGELVLNTNQTYSVSGNTDTGVWSTTGKAFAMSVTATNGDEGCTFSGKLGKSGIGSARKQGNFTCPGDHLGKWYATKG